MRILVADDEQLALEQLTETIKSVVTNAEILSFQNPKKMLEVAQNEKFDVAFLDIEMGVLNGIDVAKQLKIRYPQINIIFVTAYSKYMADAFKLRVSGYVQKPVSKQDIKEELEGLRTPVPMSDSITNYNEGILVAKCFGNFDAFVNGKSLKFERSKTKEMLAYLIDRNGSSVTSGEIRAVLWEDGVKQKDTSSYFQKIKKDLVNTFKKEGISDALIISWNKYSINKEKVKSDYFDYLDGKPEGVRSYNGEYMSQYSWGEINNVFINDSKK